MTTRAYARRLRLHAASTLLGVTVAGLATPSCYSAGGGSDPPIKSFYFPVGLAVSKGGGVLYASNSDFDLQWNGGTIQSYDLAMVRQHAASLVQFNVLGPLGQPLNPELANWFRGPNTCENSDAGYPILDNSGAREPPGEACAPAVDSTQYWRDGAVIGAAATDLQLSISGTRFYTPVRGDASLTWANVAIDDPTTLPTNFGLDCGTRVDNRCDALHHTGNDPSQPGDSRQVTMPGEPFGMAQTEDGTAIAVTHQTNTQTSLLLSGLQPSFTPADPSMQFVLNGLPTGGNGITAVPHDPDAVNRCEFTGDVQPCVRPAFLQTSRAAPEFDLLRYYDDDATATTLTVDDAGGDAGTSGDAGDDGETGDDAGTSGTSALPGASQRRPFLQKEVAFALSANSGGTDSRGIAIDPTPRYTCKALLGPNPAKADLVRCGQIPARVFIANRTPPSLIVGEIGETSATGDGSYDPDQLVIKGNIPVSNGPSRVYLAPVVDAQGFYALRVFVVCFDSATLYIIDPNAGIQTAVENVLNLGPGPFAMAFDPFDLHTVAASQALRTPDLQVPLGARPADVQNPANAGKSGVAGDADLGLRTYRFAYVASFAQSYVQVLDLDDSLKSPMIDPTTNSPFPMQQTFEHVVFTLGQPTAPKGS